MALSATVSQTERRILDAAKSCCERWGFAKVTIEDIALESGVSRATLRSIPRLAVFLGVLFTVPITLIVI